MSEIPQSPSVSGTARGPIARQHAPMAHAKTIAHVDRSIDAALGPPTQAIIDLDRDLRQTDQDLADLRREIKHVHSEVVHAIADMTLSLRHDIHALSDLVRKMRDELEQLKQHGGTPKPNG